jgi:hypothetical protein
MLTAFSHIVDISFVFLAESVAIGAIFIITLAISATTYVQSVNTWFTENLNKKQL